jgi:hypothetical protein
MTNTGSPGGTPVDIFPFRMYASYDILSVRIKQLVVRHFPSWFPGAYYTGVARRAYPAVRRLHDFPLSQVQEQMVFIFMNMAW